MWLEWKVPVVLSIAGETIEEFGAMAGMVHGTPGVAALELNLSCPNVDNGAYFSHSPEVAGETVQRVKHATSLPIIPKLSPNVPDIAPIAEAVVRAGADAITICNTMPGMAIDLETRKAVLGAVTGGISGPALHPIAVSLVYRASMTVDVPIIGVGGIFSASDALDFIMAGATAVQVGSANLIDFWAPLAVLDGLRAYLGEHGISDVAELTGAIHRGG
jgi:dihydroorotate dehydrogenase (NAD+) catalytic subunit